MAMFDHNSHYKDDELFKIRGKILNEIGDVIRDLDAQIATYKDNELYSELESLRLRDKNPALKDAWDQYQTVLQLVKK